MYGPFQKNMDPPVRFIQLLPVETHVLAAISGVNDEFITSKKNVPNHMPSGNPNSVLESVLPTMPCCSTTTVFVRVYYLLNTVLSKS